MLSDIFPSRLLRLLGMLLVCCGIGLAVGPLPANAAVGGCRADPKVWLFNGKKITMMASIAADASQVKTVTYTVHVPRGVTIDKVVYTGGALKDKEWVLVLFDRVSGYQIEARADLAIRVAPVTITAAVENDKRTLTASSTNTLVFQFP
jgi:hypothetical protein